MRGFEFDFVMQRARQAQAAEGFGGFRQLGEAGEDCFGGVHRLRGSSHRLSQHFGMFECDGDQHAGRAGWFALFLFPTAEGAESDTEEIGEGFLREVEGLTHLGNLALGFPYLSGLTALGFRVHFHSGKCAIGFLLDAKNPGGRVLASFQRIFLRLESGSVGGACSRFGGGWNGFHGFFFLSSFN